MSRDNIIYTAHKCSICECEYTDDEGGIQGYFGILPVSFCPTCFTGVMDMRDQFEDDDLLNQEREDCALMVEQMGIEGYGTLAIAAAIRARGQA